MDTTTPVSQPRRPAAAYIQFCYLVSFIQTALFIVKPCPSGFRAWIFASALTASYAFIYIIPVLLTVLATIPLRKKGPALRTCSSALIVIIAGCVQLLLAADHFIKGMFGFHINGFVINLVTTPEGLASMGADRGAKIMFCAVALLVLLANGAAWWLLVENKPVSSRIASAIPKRAFRFALGLLLAATLGERFTYGIAHNQAWYDITNVASAVPAYQPLTMRKLTKMLGLTSKRTPGLDISSSGGGPAYPTHPLETSPLPAPPHIVWLMCESLRADMLTPEIMPRTWAFAQESQRFTHHYSGGNGTRMGMFTGFYGIPGSYWFNFLGARRSPLLMDRLQQLGYSFHCSTSAAFSYPEFDKTIFARIPAECLHAKSEDQGWKSDRDHVSRMKQWLGNRKPNDPFFLFHFFESAHARYYFPPEAVIRKPYLDDFNYATVDVGKNIGLIKNRYINAVHGLDQCLGEVIDDLRTKHLLDKTVVIITGDHGEEFMEKGRWGHNSEFTEEQLRVPLVVHIPGITSTVKNYPTSHVDIVPTLLPLLGVRNPVQDYSTGISLLEDKPRLLTFADWDRIAFSTGTYKASFPLKAGAQIRTLVTDMEDRPLADPDGTLRSLGGPMVEMTTMMSRFTRKKP